MTATPRFARPALATLAWLLATAATPPAPPPDLYRYVDPRIGTGNDDQGKTASAAYTWDATQLNGETQN